MKKLILAAVIATVPVLVGCEVDDTNGDAITTQDTAQPQTTNRRQACEQFRTQICSAFQRCDLYATYEWADTAACNAWFDENVSNCGGCDKTAPDSLTVDQDGLLDDCLASMPTEECTNVGEVTYPGCDPYTTAVGNAACE